MHSHVSDLVNFYVEKYAAENDIFDEKTQNVAAAVCYIFYLKSLFITFAMCFHYFPMRNLQE